MGIALARPIDVQISSLVKTYIGMYIRMVVCTYASSTVSRHFGAETKIINPHYYSIVLMQSREQLLL